MKALQYVLSSFGLFLALLASVVVEDQLLHSALVSVIGETLRQKSVLLYPFVVDRLRYTIDQEQ